MGKKDVGDWLVIIGGIMFAVAFILSILDIIFPGLGNYFLLSTGWTVILVFGGLICVVIGGLMGEKKEDTP